MNVPKALGAAALCGLIATPTLAHMPGISEVGEGDRNAPIAEALTELARRQAEDARIARNLETFRELDLEIFSNAEIERFDESHTDDVVVYYPDGRVTKGIDVHIEDVKWFFVWAPDTHVERHIVRFGQGEWTAAIGILKGRHVYRADADAGWQRDRTHGQRLRNHFHDNRPLERRR